MPALSFSSFQVRPQARTSLRLSLSLSVPRTPAAVCIARMLTTVRSRTYRSCSSSSCALSYIVFLFANACLVLYAGVSFQFICRRSIGPRPSQRAVATRSSVRYHAAGRVLSCRRSRAAIWSRCRPSGRTCGRRARFGQLGKHDGLNAHVAACAPALLCPSSCPCSASPRSGPLAPS